MQAYIKNQREVQFDFDSNSWVFPLFSYKEVLQFMQSKCEKVGFRVNEISLIAFDAIDYPVPFSNPVMKSILKYNYTNDLKNKPKLSQLPLELLNRLYNFQKVGI
jgi:hypothetical protein